MAKYTELRAKKGKDGKMISGAVFRITVDSFDHHGRRMVVGLEPGDIITFREERCSQKYSLPIRWAMMRAVRNYAEQKASERAKERKLRRGLAVR